MDINSKTDMMDFADAAATEEEDDLVQLRNWIEDDAADNSAAAMESQSILDMQHQSRPNETKRRWKESMIRKATVAYGIVELLVRCPDNDVALDDEAMICIDNFAVFCKKGGIRSSSQQQRSSSWTDVKGVSMISSGMSLSIEEPSYMSF